MGFQILPENTLKFSIVYNICDDSWTRNDNGLVKGLYFITRLHGWNDNRENLNQNGLQSLHEFYA